MTDAEHDTMLEAAAIVADNRAEHWEMEYQKNRSDLESARRGSEARQIAYLIRCLKTREPVAVDPQRLPANRLAD
ncbi:MAG: hypothetical protein KDI08_07230 [Pseudomonadales bacterium]|nr:hypothetical protein [Pseudomonadales bacterium]